jgi:Helix-turn-helix domain
MTVTTKVAADLGAPRLFTRADALSILKIGETTLHWLQRTGKLRPVRIGARVLFQASEIERIAARGASLTAAEKGAAAKCDQTANRKNIGRSSKTAS